MLTIDRLAADEAQRAGDDLVALLRNVVDDGASIGFLPPLDAEEARAYWQGVIEDLRRGPRVLLVARVAGALVGSVQLDPATRPNGRHRAEVQKLMVHSAARRNGVGRALVAAVEEVARELGRSLLVLDTRRGDVAEHLYRNAGYVQAGIIPNYALSPTGADDTVLFYKLLPEG